MSFTQPPKVSKLGNAFTKRKSNGVRMTDWEEVSTTLPETTIDIAQLEQQRRDKMKADWEAVRKAMVGK